MSTTCDPNAQQVTADLGFDCNDVSPWLSINNPFDHYDWTMPFLEIVVIAGAVFALVHAIRRWRHHGDPVNISLWFASLTYLAVVEPPLYFPEWFGLDQIYGFIFAHNQFTVQFMWDRLPLYIVAIYPALTALSYEVVRSIGVFRRRGALVGAICVAFVSQVFYEVFDQLGPQLKWWAWNPDNQIVNSPSLASVPMTSMLLFASVSLGFLTYLVVRLVGPEQHQPAPAGGSLLWRTLLAGAVTPLGMGVVSIPHSIFGGDTPNTTAQAWILGVELALVWLAGVWLLGRELTADDAQPGEASRFALIYPAVYIAAMMVFWVSALPEFFAAMNGVTDAGTPVGSGWYTIACFVGAGFTLVVLYGKHRQARATGPVPMTVPTTPPPTR